MEGKRLALAAAAAAAAVSALVALRRLKKNRKLPPGSFGLPLLGEMLDYAKDPALFVSKRLVRYGGTFKTNVLLQKSVFIKPTPANIKLLYSLRDLGWPDHWKDVLGRSSLAMVNDPLHKRIRAVSGRAFTQARLDSYLPIFMELTQQHLAKWASVTEPRDMRPGIKVYTFDLAQRALFGERFTDEMTARCAALFEIAMQGLACMFPYHFPGSFWSKTQRARKKLVDIYQEVIDRRRAELASKGPEASCMLDMVLAADGKEGGAPSDAELQDFCVTMAFAGHDTTLATAQGALHFLKAVPGIEEELRGEVDAAWDGVAPVSRELLQRLPKCKAFVTEVLRGAPPVPAVVRTLQRDTVVDGYEVPAGFQLGMVIPSVSQQQYGVEEAAKIKLDRHLDAAGHFVDRIFDVESFASFGGGSRMCIGYKFAMDELLVFLLVLLRGYSFAVEPLEESFFPFRSFRVRASFRPRGA